MHNRLKTARKALGLSQAAVAAGIGYSQGYYAGIESGARQLPPRIATAICEKFGINREWLETGGGDMFLEPAPPKIEAILEDVRKHLDLPDVAFDVLRAYAMLPAEQRAKVKDMITMLRDAANMPPPES